jgi:hypothetical protein
MEAIRLEHREQRDALERLFRVAGEDISHAHAVAEFLLALHRTEDDGGWFLIDPNNFEAATADDIQTVMRSVRDTPHTAGDIEFLEEIRAALRLWVRGRASKPGRADVA